MVGNRAAGEVTHSTPVGSIEVEDTLVQADVPVISGNEGANKVHDSAAIFTSDCCIRNTLICIDVWLSIGSGIPGGEGRGGEGKRKLTVVARGELHRLVRFSNVTCTPSLWMKPSCLLTCH